ncbi:MAG: hypothetical protein F4Y94_01635, partial [Chloroflexi bacterium]|nr:hypothetical protein [Chloroflexota bacterium]
MIRHRLLSLLSLLRRHIFDSLAGVIAAGFALGVAELVAGITGGSSLITAVGNIVVDTTPGPVIKLAIDLFGTNDKPVLLALIVIISLALGGALGPVARYRFSVAAIAFGVFGLAGAAAGVSDPLSSDVASIITAIAAAVAGWLAFRVLLNAATIEPATPDADATAAEAAALAPGPKLVDRRRFLGAGGAAVAGAALTAIVGRFVFD